MQQADAANSSGFRDTSSGNFGEFSDHPLIVLSGALMEQDDRITELFDAGSILRTAMIAVDAVAGSYGLLDGTKRAVEDIWATLATADRKLSAAIERIVVLHEEAFARAAQLRAAA